MEKLIPSTNLHTYWDLGGMFTLQTCLWNRLPTMF